MGKLLIVVGFILIIAGIIVNYADKIPFLGKMPGDTSVERENFKFYFSPDNKYYFKCVDFVDFVYHPDHKKIINSR